MKTDKYSTMTAIAVSKSLLKEYQTSYGRTVYLDKDSEFQIKLFNPTSNTIGAEVFINGKLIGVPIIIRPGQLIWLERYLDEARKFRFDTYEVEMNSDEVREAIANNGNIQVKFYKEIVTIYKGITFKYNAPALIDNGINYGNIKYATNNIVSDTYSIADCDLTNISQTIYSCNSDATFSANPSSLKFINTTTTHGLNKRALFNYAKPQSNETGRVEKGGYSDQRFTTVDIDLEAWPFMTETIKLLPKSQKPVFKEDLQKLYCTACGRKVKPKFKYCPFCGGKL
jgi:hypothetical protein